MTTKSNSTIPWVVIASHFIAEIPEHTVCTTVLDYFHFSVWIGALLNGFLSFIFDQNMTILCTLAVDVKHERSTFSIIQGVH